MVLPAQSPAALCSIELPAAQSDGEVIPAAPAAPPVSAAAARTTSAAPARDPCAATAVTDFQGDEFVRFEVGQGVAQITLTQPQENNCLSDGLSAGLSAAVATLHARPDIRLVFLAAEGRNFCAGGDPKSFQAAAAMSDEDNLAGAVTLAKFFLSIQVIDLFCASAGVTVVVVVVKYRPSRSSWWGWCKGLATEVVWAL